MEKTKFTDYLMAWSNAALAFFAVATTVLALAALLVSDRTQRESKKMDLLSDYQRRYEQIVYDVQERATNRLAGTNYYHRFWDLLNEEFSSWAEGYVEPAMFASWMEFRQREWSNAPPVGDVSYKDGWYEGSNYLRRPEFACFMAIVFSGTNDSVYTNPPSYWKDYWKNNLSKSVH